MHYVALVTPFQSMQVELSPLMLSGQSDVIVSDGDGEKFGCKQQSQHWALYR